MQLHAWYSFIVPQCAASLDRLISFFLHPSPSRDWSAPASGRSSPVSPCLSPRQSDRRLLRGNLGAPYATPTAVAGAADAVSSSRLFPLPSSALGSDVDSVQGVNPPGNVGSVRPRIGVLKNNPRRYDEDYGSIDYD